jgi:hypothetical protein
MSTVFGGTLVKASQNRSYGVDDTMFGKKVGLFGKIFGCGHKEISRPFSNGKVGYRTCLECGARKHFDPETLETFGGFYYPPVY